MHSPEIPANEIQRLAALRERELLDTPAEESFDRFTRLAQQLFGTQIVAVSLIDEDRQWFKSHPGLDTCQTGRDISFCGHAILGAEIFEVPDARQDPRFHDNPLVTGPPAIRFYAGAPLTTRDGFRLGTLCLIDPQSRTLNDREKALLRDIANCVEAEIEVVKERQLRHRLAQSEARSKAILDALPDNVYVIKGDGGCHQSSGEQVGEVLNANSACCPISQVLPERANKPYLAALALLASQNHASFEYDLEQEDEVRYYEARLQALPDKKVMMIIRDVTSQKAAALMVQQQKQISEIIARAQTHFIREPDRAQAFQSLLSDTLTLTGSTFGFICEVHQLPNGPSSFEIFAVSGGAGADPEDCADLTNTPVHELERLSQQTLLQSEPLFLRATDPQVDAVPGLKTFLGVQLQYGDRLMGILGLANRSEGYPAKLPSLIQPLIVNMGQLIEAQRTQNQLRQDEVELARLSQVASQTTNGVVVADANGLVEWTNEGFTRITGYSLAEMRGRSPGQLLQGQATDRATVARMHDAIQLGKAFNENVLNYSKAGLPYWVHISCNPLHDDAGQLRGFIAIESDITLQIEAAEALRDQAEHTQAVLDNMADGLLTFDNSGTIHAFNPAAQHIFGYTTEEIFGTKVDDLIAFPNEETLEPGFDYACLANQLLGKGRETSGRRQNGEQFPLELTVSRITYRGDPLYVAIVRDITQSKRAEYSLNQFKGTLDRTLDCIFMFEPLSLKFYYANHGALLHVGYDLDELCQLHPYDIKPEYPEPLFRKMIVPLLSGELASVTFETVHRHKNGTLIPVEIFLQYIAPEGEPARFVAIVRDITERRQSQIALKDQALHTQAIIYNMVDGIVTIDKLGTISSFNPAAESIFGYLAQEVLGQNVKLLMPNPYHDQHDEYLRNYQRTNVPRIIGIGREVQGKRKNGEIFPLDLAISEVKRQGIPIYVGIVRDITERKRIERMKSEFVSTVSHELRTPLSAISGALGLLSGGVTGPLPKHAEQMISIAHKNSLRLTYLINDLLDMEKIAAGKTVFDMQIQALTPIIEQALEANRGYGAEHRIKLTMAESHCDVWVKADSQRLMQVMSNLLSNAIKFSPLDGTVTVTTEVQQNIVRVTVTDLGPGVPESFRDRIFQKFAQADSSDTRQKGGTGLGLAITRELLERMGGRIGFESIPGQGASFYFELERWQDKTHTNQTDPTLERGFNCEHILIAEADQGVAHQLSLLLTRAGYQTSIAYNGAEVLRALDDQTYSAMTLGLLLPDAGGLKLLQQIRHQPEPHNLPVIVVSTNVEEGRLSLNGDLMAVEWLPKPVVQEYLDSMLEWVFLSPNQAGPKQILLVGGDSSDFALLGSIAGTGFSIQRARDIIEARKLLTQDVYDMVILDIGQPDGSDWELLRAIRVGLPNARVAILLESNLSPDQMKQAEAILSKSQTSPTALLAAIQARLGAQDVEGLKYE